MHLGPLPYPARAVCHGFDVPIRGNVDGYRPALPPLIILSIIHDERILMTTAEASGPFLPGVIVLVTLASPREKFWGAILSVSSAGISLRGCELVSFEDCVAMMRAGESYAPAVVFFPMHRVERVEMDASANGLPSLADRFAAETGVDAEQLLVGKPGA